MSSDSVLGSVQQKTSRLKGKKEGRGERKENGESLKNAKRERERKTK
jgi:hypothetical protein